MEVVVYGIGRLRPLSETVGFQLALLLLLVQHLQVQWRARFPFV